MELIERLRQLVHDNCAAVIDDGHDLAVQAVGGEEHMVFEVSCEPRDEGLILGTPCRHGTDPHGHTRFAAVLVSEKPLQEAVTRLVLRSRRVGYGRRGSAS